MSDQKILICMCCASDEGINLTSKAYFAYAGTCAHCDQLGVVFDRLEATGGQP